MGLPCLRVRKETLSVWKRGKKNQGQCMAIPDEAKKKKTERNLERKRNLR